MSIVKIDKEAMLDLIASVDILVAIIKDKLPQSPLTEDEALRISYVDKLIKTATQSFKNNNPCT